MMMMDVLITVAASTVNALYNEQNLAVYNCEFLEILRLEEGFVVGKLFKIKKEPQYKNHYVLTVCVCVFFIACIGCVSSGVLL
jgi:hypothetical protein